MAALLSATASGFGQSVTTLQREGRQLFEDGTFGGNGRTCVTCHSRNSGTVSIGDVNRRLRRDPNDALFLQDGSDDGQGNGVTRILANATIRITLPLPANVSLAHREEDGSLTILPDRYVTVNRGIPSTLNTPALDPILMYDGREPNLQSQALGAIHAHAQNTIEPTARELELIAEFQQTRSFFSSEGLRRFAENGIVPELPRGNTPSQKRGRRFFVETVMIPFMPATGGHCAQCHSGPMLNEISGPEFQLQTSLPRGARFQNILTSEFNGGRLHDFNMNPMQTFVFDTPDGKVVVDSPDLGRAGITGDPSVFPAFDQLNAFKISSLWGVPLTAPYFHDNSARTLEDVANHYQLFFETEFQNSGGFIDQRLTDQDKQDIVAFLRLL